MPPNRVHGQHGHGALTGIEDPDLHGIEKRLAGTERHRGGAGIHGVRPGQGVDHVLRPHGGGTRPGQDGSQREDECRGANRGAGGRHATSGSAPRQGCAPTEARERHQRPPGLEARGTDLEIVAQLERSLRDPARVGRQEAQQLHVGGPTLAPHHALVGRDVAEGLLQHDDPVGPQPAHGIGHGRLLPRPAQREAGEAARDPQRLGKRLQGGREGAGHDVGAALQHLHQPHHVFGALGEVTLQHHRAVPLRVRRHVGDLPQQALHGAGIAQRLFGAEDRERQGPAIAAQHLRRSVGGGVIEDQDLVIPAELAQDPAHLPEEHADGGGLVARGDADVDQAVTVRFGS